MNVITHPYFSLFLPYFNLKEFNGLVTVHENKRSVNIPVISRGQP